MLGLAANGRRKESIECAVSDFNEVVSNLAKGMGGTIGMHSGERREDLNRRSLGCAQR